MADFCGEFPNRLKGLIVDSTRNVEVAVREIREWEDSKWAVAIKPLMPFDMPPGRPGLEPIWRAAEHNLAVAHHVTARPNERREPAPWYRRLAAEIASLRSS
jgi:hypothetical protein